MKKIIYSLFFVFFLFSCFWEKEDIEIETNNPEPEIIYSQEDLNKECDSIIIWWIPNIVEKTPSMDVYNDSKLISIDWEYSNALLSWKCNTLEWKNNINLCEAYLTWSIEVLDINDVWEYDYYLYKSLILNEDFCDEIQNEDVEECRNSYLSTIAELTEWVLTTKWSGKWWLTWTWIFGTEADSNSFSYTWTLFNEEKSIKENFILKYWKDKYFEKINKEFLLECKRYIIN